MSSLPLGLSDRQLIVEVLEHMLVLEAKMVSGFESLQQAVEAMSGEGGEITQAKDAILVAIAGLQTVVSTLQTNLTAAQEATAQAQADLAAGRQVADSSVATLNDTKAQFDVAEQQLNDAAAALQQPPPTP